MTRDLQEGALGLVSNHRGELAVFQVERVLRRNLKGRQESAGSRKDHGAIPQVEDQGAATAFQGPAPTRWGVVPPRDKMDAGS